MSRKTSILLIAALAILFSSAAGAAGSLEAARKLAAQGDPAAALRMVDQQLGGDPDLPEGLFLKGVLLVELRRAEEARTIFERLIELQPDLPEPYNNLAVIQAAAGDYESAVATLRKSLQTHSSYRTAYENLTKIYTQLASDAYSQALEAPPAERPEVVELVLLGTLGEFVGVRADSGDEPTPEAQIAATEPTAVTQSPPAPAPAPRGEAGPPAPAVSGPGPTAESVAPFVESWRSAWQDQRVNDYLAAYSKDFRPADGTSRDLWSAQRRERLAAPEFIRVTLAYLDEPRVDGATAEIRFLQSYESDTFQDRVTKTLRLTWEDGGWKILEERAD